MSTTGNEFEEPGVNYPDRNDADGATDTPGDDDPVRDDAGVESTTDAAADQPVADPADPDHQAVGVGVMGDPDHHGRDGSRDTLTAGQAQRALSDEQEQRLPAMSQNNAPDVDKVAGIVAQTRQDVGHLDRERVVQVLTQRLEQTGVSLPHDEVEELADQIYTGDDEA